MNNKPDISALAEQLCRIEHKIDLVVSFLASRFPDFELRPIGDPEHFDPLTQEVVAHIMDLMRGHVVRQTRGGTGIVPGLGGPYANPLGENNGSNTDGTPSL